MIKYWMLDKNHQLVAAKDVIEWGRYFETAERHVAQDFIGDVKISTVFLGIDHGGG